MSARHRERRYTDEVPWLSVWGMLTLLTCSRESNPGFFISGPRRTRQRKGGWERVVEGQLSHYSQLPPCQTCQVLQSKHYLNTFPAIRGITARIWACLGNLSDGFHNFRSQFVQLKRLCLLLTLMLRTSLSVHSKTFNTQAICFH